ncbi:hypothetical protein MPSEU_000805600 [Mayamaea pseudoterrestris]|nr:hypothetical protein MPSEU_000805600 [Mayamaea pseudoterrestris]
MRVLLTGASGYLGQHVLYSFLTKPPPNNVHHIYALVNSATTLDGAVRKLISDLGERCCVQVSVEAVDLTDPASVDSFFQRHPSMDVCIHAAALSVPRLCEQDPDKAMKINNPTLFFDALIRSNTAIIAMSTDQVYKGDPSEAPYSEIDPTHPVNVYGQSKRAMEKYILDNYPHRSVVLRSSLIIGPKAPLAKAHDTFLHFIATRDQQETTFYTDECRSAVYVNDVVSCIAWFLQNALESLDNSGGDRDCSFASAGVYNLGGPASCSRMDMAKAVFEWLEYDSKFLIPARKNEEVPLPSADAQVAAVTSPLDISMKMDKLQRTTGLTMTTLGGVVTATFSN